MMQHSMSCEFPEEGCSCWATQWNRLEQERDALRAEREELKKQNGGIEILCEENRHLRAQIAHKNHLLRAFRYSMDRAVPFPSLEKLTEAINDVDVDVTPNATVLEWIESGKTVEDIKAMLK